LGPYKIPAPELNFLVAQVYQKNGYTSQRKNTVLLNGREWGMKGNLIGAEAGEHLVNILRAWKQRSVPAKKRIKVTGAENMQIERKKHI
jgi:hypothetical protein